VCTLFKVFLPDNGLLEQMQKMLARMLYRWESEQHMMFIPNEFQRAPVANPLVSRKALLSSSINRKIMTP
jgi:hypothetical protein